MPNLFFAYRHRFAYKLEYMCMYAYVICFTLGGISGFDIFGGDLFAVSGSFNFSLVVRRDLQQLSPLQVIADEHWGSGNF